jgi:hypothetical protein
VSVRALHRKDLIGGGLMLALGIGAALQASQYEIGSLSHMGPGYVPLALGVILAATGALIMLAGLRSAPAEVPAAGAPAAGLSAAGVPATGLPVGGLPVGGLPATGVPASSAPASAGPGTPLRPEWRGWFCICGGLIAFAVMGRYGGLLPATFVSVFIAALGDRTNTPAASAVLAAAMTLVCLVVFWWLLKIQLPLFGWG